MGLNDTPSSERIHIGFFGKRNAGKSSLVNAVTGQDLSVVSDVKGTTTDPVYKTMELLPLGPVVIIDTPGFDDEGELGSLRIKKTNQAMNRCDIAVLVIDAKEGKSKSDEEMIAAFQEKKIPYLIVYNKSDISSDNFSDGIPVSAKTKENIYELKEKIANFIQSDGDNKRLVGDLLQPGDTVILVIPIDKAAPKGRLILPQQQVIRDILDMGGKSLVVKESEFSETLSLMKEKPALVITDSQVFERINKETPKDILLTSFSILMARYKGFLDAAIEGVVALDSICDGDKILISEGCTHHRQCDDIGTVKLPRWIKQYTGKKPLFEFTSGREFPTELAEYKLVIHCGGCMLNEREMRYRMKTTLDAGKPFTNYGTVIAYVNGILPRTLEIFPNLQKKLKLN